jgi:hypothetical protein
MTQVVHAFETSVYANETTRLYIPQGSHRRTQRRENLNSQIKVFIYELFELELCHANTAHFYSPLLPAAKGIDLSPRNKIINTVLPESSFMCIQIKSMLI